MGVLVCGNTMMSLYNTVGCFGVCTTLKGGSGVVATDVVCAASGVVCVGRHYECVYESGRVVGVATREWASGGSLQQRNRTSKCQSWCVAYQRRIYL